MDDLYYHNGRLEAYKGYATDIWFRLGREFIKKSKWENKLFFLYLPVNAPHIPWLVPEHYRKPYLDKGLDERSINFYAMISTVDSQLGLFLRFLEEENLRENTIFIFLTDNGSTLWNQKYNAGLRGKKGSIYEGGHRVPCFISRPAGGLAAPGDIADLTECQDILPTLMDLCGIETPRMMSVEGTSLAALLRNGQQGNLADRILVVQHSPQKYKGTVMWESWRLVYGKELYDLNTDPGQEKTLPVIMPILCKNYNLFMKNGGRRPVWGKICSHIISASTTGRSC